MADATPEPTIRPAAVATDRLIDENASPINVPDNSGLRRADGAGTSVGATGPTNWWRLGLLALAIVVAILFVLQLLNGAPGTDVQSGTPVSEPVVEPVAPQP
jgi:hypothetical protein